MRIPRHLFDALKTIDANNGGTKEVEMLDLDRLVSHGLVVEKPEYGDRYEFEITPRGQAAIADRPVDSHKYQTP